MILASWEVHSRLSSRAEDPEALSGSARIVHTYFAMKCMNSVQEPLNLSWKSPTASSISSKVGTVSKNMTFCISL